MKAGRKVWSVLLVAALLLSMVIPVTGAAEGNAVLTLDTPQNVTLNAEQTYTYEVALNDAGTYLLEFVSDDPQIMAELEILVSRGANQFTRDGVQCAVFTVEGQETVTVSVCSKNTVSGQLGVFTQATIDALHGEMARGFDIPADGVSTFAGQTFGLTVYPTTAHSCNVVYTWETSNAEIVALTTENDSGPQLCHGYMWFKGITPGTAIVTVTATSAGGTVTASFPVTVKAPTDSFVMDETKTITVPAHTTLGYTFTPEYTGGYLFYGPNNNAKFSIDVIPDYSCDSADETRHYFMSSELIGGMEYLLKVVNETDQPETTEITLREMEIILDKHEIRIEAGSTDPYTLDAVCLLLNTIIDVSSGEWESSDPDVVTVSGSGTSATLTPVGEGIAKVSFTFGCFRDECTVIVGDFDGALEIAGSVDVDLEAGASKKYLLTPDVAGEYCLFWPEESGALAVSVNGNAADQDTVTYEEGQWNRAVMTLEAGKNYTVTFTNEAAESFAAQVQTFRMTDSINVWFSSGEEYLKVGDSLTLKSFFGDVNTDLSGVTWVVEDDDIAQLVLDDRYNAVVTGKAVGETEVLILDADQQILASCKIQVIDPAAGAVAQWDVTHAQGTENQLSVTVDETGYYFLKLPQGIAVYYELCEAPEDTVELGGYDADGYTGSLYYMIAGESYGFFGMSYEDCRYTMYLEAVKMAQNITLSQTQIAGEAGQPVKLTYSYDGIPLIDCASADQNVARWYGGAVGEIEVMLLKQGVTTITVTNNITNETVGTITVTVEAQSQPLQLVRGEWYEGLGIGGDGYQCSFTPETSQWYFFSQERESETKLQYAVTDAAGGNVETIPYTQRTRKGVLCRLDAGVTYTVKLTATGGTTADIMVVDVEEATDFSLFQYEVFGQEGKMERLPFALIPDGTVPSQMVAKSNDETVVRIGDITDEGVALIFTGAGTAEVTVTLGGKEETCTVTVEGLSEEQKLYPDTPKTVTLGADPVEFYFTPETTDLYWLCRTEEIMGYVGIETVIDYEDNWIGGEYGYNNGEFYGEVYRLTGGVTYRVIFFADTEMTIQLLAAKALPITAIDVEEQITLQQGMMVTVPITLSPAGAAERFRIVSDDEDTVAVSSWSGRSMNLEPKKVGTAQLTIITESGLTKTVQVTVEPVPQLALNEKQTVYYNENEDVSNFVFIPEVSGYYSLNLLSDGYGVAGFYEGRGQEYDPDMEFVLTEYMIAGKTYQIQVLLYDDVASGMQVWISEAVMPTALEITQLPQQLEYVEGCVDQGVCVESLEGLVIKITWSDGKVTTHTAQQIEESMGTLRGMPMGLAVQENTDGTGLIAIACGTVYDSFDITLIKDPVASIEVLNPTGAKLPADTYGYYNGMGWIYPDMLMRDPLQLKVTYTDGTVETVSMRNERLNGYQILFDGESSQHEQCWTLGKHKVSVSYMNHTVQAEVEVVENTVKKIELVSAPTTRFVFGNEDYGVVDEDGGYTFIPGNYDLYKGLSFKITYTDGTVETVTADQLSWPQGTEYDWASFGYYKGMPVETYVEGYDYGDYLSGDWFEEPGTLEMTIRYAGKTDQYTLTLNAAHTHALTHVSAQAPTCTKEGNIEYWSCSGCGVLFGDAEGKTQVQDVVLKAAGHKLEKTVGKAATCTQDGNITYWTCSVCKAKFSDEAGKTAVESITVTKNGHVLAEVKAVESTCTEDGVVRHWICTACEGLFSDAKGEEPTTAEKVKVPAGHKLTKVEAKDATYTAPGNIAHWTCSGCDTLFGDAQAKTEVTDVVIPQLVKVEEEKATVSEGAVDNAIEEALKPGTGSNSGSGTAGNKPEKAETIEVVVSVKNNAQTDTAISAVVLPVTSVEKLVEANEQTKEEVVLTVEMNTATVTLDSKALEAVADQVKGQEVTLMVEEVKPQELNKVQQNVIKNRDVAMVISAELVSGETSVHDFKGGSVTIRLPFTPEQGRKGNDYTILYVADDGKLEKIKTHYEDGQLVFTLSHFSDYVVALDVEKDNPGTGDAMNLGLMAVLAMVSGLLLAGECLFGKKRFR